MIQLIKNNLENICSASDKKVNFEFLIGQNGFGKTKFLKKEFKNNFENIWVEITNQEYNSIQIKFVLKKNKQKERFYFFYNKLVEDVDNQKDEKNKIHFKWYNEEKRSFFYLSDNLFDDSENNIISATSGGMTICELIFKTIKLIIKNCIEYFQNPVFFIEEPAVFMNYYFQQDLAFYFSQIKKDIKFKIITHFVEFLKWFFYYFDKENIDLLWFYEKDEKPFRFNFSDKKLKLGKKEKHESYWENLMNCFFNKKIIFVEDEAHKKFIEKLIDLFEPKYSFYIFIAGDKPSVLHFYEYFKKRLGETIMNKNFFVVFDVDDKVNDKTSNDKFEKIKNNIRFSNKNIENEFDYQGRKEDLNWIDELFENYRKQNLNKDHQSKIENCKIKMENFLNKE